MLCLFLFIFFLSYPLPLHPHRFLFGFHFISTQIGRRSFNLADNLRMCLFRHLSIVLASCGMFISTSVLCIEHSSVIGLASCDMCISTICFCSFYVVHWLLLFSIRIMLLNLLFIFYKTRLVRHSFWQNLMLINRQFEAIYCS